MMFGALPQGILGLLPRLLNLSPWSPGPASGLARTKAGVKQVAKASNEPNFPNGDILQ